MSAAAETLREATAKVAHRARAEHRAYAHGEDRPIGSYSALLAIYSTMVFVLGLVVRKRKALPNHVSPGDLALLSIASHKLSRVIAKDSVTAVVRAPFTQFEEASGEGEVNDSPRGDGVKHAVGELLTCPFCLSVWVATAFAFGLVLAPRATRLAAATLTAVTASDYLQFAHAALQRAEANG
jgi:hypothetical protein